jgi:glucose/mannose-6-phosphate isomerase
MTPLPLAEGVLDSDAMYAATAAFPEQLETAAKSVKQLSFERTQTPRAIVMAGMGGSAVAGEIALALGVGRTRVPMVGANSYELPAFVNEESLLFAVSFSGATEETLAVAKSALERGAEVIAVTSGGALAELCRSAGGLVITMPNDIPQPRAALGASLAPVLLALEQRGLFDGASELIDQAIVQLQRRRDELVQPGTTIAKQIAHRVDRSFPFIFGGAGIGAVAARRWKTQVNENAKTAAFFSVHPEACHNEIVGYGLSGDVTRQVLTMIELRSDFEHPRTALRFSLVEDALREVFADVIEVRAKGDGPLAQLLDLVLVGDFMSLHLATQAGIDPGPVPILVEIKQALARSQ